MRRAHCLIFICRSSTWRVGTGKCSWKGGADVESRQSTLGSELARVSTAQIVFVFGAVWRSAAWITQRKGGNRKGITERWPRSNVKTPTTLLDFPAFKVESGVLAGELCPRLGACSSLTQTFTFGRSVGQSGFWVALGGGLAKGFLCLLFRYFSRGVGKQLRSCRQCRLPGRQLRNYSLEM